MSAPHRGPVVFLGPQRRDPIVCEAIDHFVSDRTKPVAVITAGWEEREAEDRFREVHGRGGGDTSGL